LYVSGILWLGLLVGSQAPAQVTTADIVGTALDSAGAVVAGAKVTVDNIATHQVRTVQSGNSGDYGFTLLPPGTYSVTVEAPGFKTFKVSNLPLLAGERSRIDAHLEIGQTSQTLEVTGTPSALQTDSSALSTSITNTAVQDLPLNGRNFLALVQTTPGASQGNPNSISSGQRPDDRRQTNSVSANGQPEEYNNNLVDGMDNNELEQGLIMIRPSIDSIQEVKVITNSFSAELGRTPGAVIDVITKSGTNRFHGSLYEFWGNDKLNANDYFSKRANPRPEYRLNQFGGSLGGPILKDKTFFFGDVEAYRIVQGAPTGLITVPTLYEEKHPGDFSDQGGPVITTLDPVALQYFALYPAPNIGGPTTFINNYSNSPKRTQNSTTADVRIDHHFSPNDQLYGRYSYNPVKTFTPGALPVINGIQAGGGTNYPGNANETAQGGALNYVHIFTPNLLMELTMGVVRFDVESLQLNYGTNLAQKFGIPNVNNYDHYNSGLPPINITGYVSLGDADQIPIVDINNVFQYAGSATYTHGRNTWKMGTGFIRRQLNYYQAVMGQGEFTFSFGSPLLNLENFIQGTPSTIARQNQLYTNYMRTTEPHAYVQDDLRLTRTLTLNLGLRWDYFSPITNPTYQRSNFDLDTLQIVVASKSNPTAGVHSDWKDWSPRFGFAQSLPHNMVLRGGFGMSYYNPYTGAAALNLPNAPYYPVAFTCQPFSSNAALHCPVGLGTLSEGPPFPAPTSITALTGGLTGIPKDAKASYVEQYNLTLQKQFGPNTVAATYLGSLGRRQEIIVNYDLPYLSGSTVVPQFYYQAQLPKVNAITFRKPGGDSAYNALQVVFDRRYAKGLTLNTSYNYASNLNDFPDTSGSISTAQQVRGDYRHDYGSSDIAVRHRFVLALNYELPFAASAGGAKRLLLAGWQVNTLSSYQTGNPITIKDSAFPVAPINLPGVSSDRPSKVAGASFTPAKRTLAEWFNISAFTVQPPGTPGNSGRNQIWGPNTRQLDLSVFKSFLIHENYRLQFQASAYNLTNTENFGQPGNTITKFTAGNTVSNSNVATNTGGFGQVTSTRLGAIPRQFQFALKLTF
jgi:hypothetical protein